MVSRFFSLIILSYAFIVGTTPKSFLDTTRLVARIEPLLAELSRLGDGHHGETKSARGSISSNTDGDADSDEQLTARALITLVSRLLTHEHVTLTLYSIHPSIRAVPCRSFRSFIRGAVIVCSASCRDVGTDPSICLLT